MHVKPWYMNTRPDIILPFQASVLDLVECLIETPLHARFDSAV